MFRSFYYQFVNFIQEMHPAWFALLWLAIFVCSAMCVMKFFMAYKHKNKQTKFVKVGVLISAVLLFALLIFLTYIRK